MKIVISLVLLVLITSCNEQPYRTYSNVSEAVNAGEETRGWLAPWFPRSGVNVHLQGDADTNFWWLRADLSEAAADSLKAILVPANPDSVVLSHPRRSSRWWFEALVQQAPENDAALNADIYRGSGRLVPATVMVAFDRSSSAVYAWSTVVE